LGKLYKRKGKRKKGRVKKKKREKEKEREREGGDEGSRVNAKGRIQESFFLRDTTNKTTNKIQERFKK